jgi:chemotaxis protein MotB
MGGGSGGAWKVAYADFVTAMMAFFMVMWLVGQSKPVKQAVAEYFEDPLGVNKGSRSTSLKGPEDATTSGAFQSGRGPGRGLAMANLKAAGNKNPQGTAAKKPEKIILGRHLNRSRSTGTAILFHGESTDLDEHSLTRLDALLPQLLGKSNKVEVRVYTPRLALAPDSQFPGSSLTPAARRR